MSDIAPGDDMAALKARADAQWQRTLVERRAMPRLPWKAISGVLLLAVGCVILLVAGRGPSSTTTTTTGHSYAPVQFTPPSGQGLPPEFFG